ncbi:MAG: enoyl-CoA hydratase [Candidatus Eremiobacteraeota bacterium]|nr:enoyl-CoA hydratase [Candidatus Eremiobacteraeota bacterium]
MHVLSENTDGIVVLTLNRPEKRNALSLEVMRELTLAFAEVGADRNHRVVVLRAEGPAFSAGHDLAELIDATIEEQRETFEACVTLMQTIQAIPQPVIAEVDGIATAAGCQLVATCDLAIASDRAKFATPGVRIGLFCTTPMVALTRAIGPKRAMQMLLTGDMIDAQTAAQWGLVNRVVTGEALHEQALLLARKIAEASSVVVGLGKSAFYTQIDLNQRSAYAYAKEIMTMNALENDAQEGMSAFLAKRTPVWQG